MLDINIIRKNPDIVRKALKDRNMNPKLVDEFLSLDEGWRKLTTQIDEQRAQLNKFSKERNIEAGKKVKEEIKKFESKIKDLERKREKTLNQLPNISAGDVPVGKDASGNVVIWKVGKPSNDKVIDYLTLAEKLDLIDVDRASKVSGSRFGYLKREAALLEFALVQFAFDILTKEGFIPVVPPVLVKPKMMIGMGKIKFIEGKDAFYLPEDKLYLAGSAEHTIGPMHADEVFDEKDLPRRYVGFSTCFRREAGSYGKDTRGILRVHQFDKVEMFSFSEPEESESEHQFLVFMQEKMMQELELPYQVVQNCTGDMGFDTAKQFDIETWLPSENKYRETHSASNTLDFQARGLNVKYASSKLQSAMPTGRQANRKSEYVHMLNATAIAIGRMIIAILENYQTKSGSIKIPKSLVKYTGFKEIKR